jgi:hypothetical protein
MGLRSEDAIEQNGGHGNSQEYFIVLGSLSFFDVGFAIAEEKEFSKKSGVSQRGTLRFFYKLIFP